MRPPSFLHNIQARLRESTRYLRRLGKNRYFWTGLAGLLALFLGGYVLINHLVMPAYTRHGVVVRVPPVVDRPFEEAADILRDHDLRAERVVERFNPALPQDSVVEQNPPPRAQVKPGRRVYLTVNTGTPPMVKIPPLKDLSLREARNRLRALGLTIDEERPDSIPSPFPNTVTHQSPAPGDSLPKGSGVTIWYSTGLGDRYVTIPDVTDRPLGEAQRRLLARKIRSVVVSTPQYDPPPNAPVDRNTYATDDAGDSLVVERQSRAPGTRVREGFEIRLFVRPADTTATEDDDGTESLR